MPTKAKTQKTLQDEIDAAEKKADKLLDDPAEVKDPDQIADALDRALVVAKRQIKRGTRNFLNVLFVGEAGTGKTARIKAWAESRGINLVQKMASTMDDTDLGGAIYNKNGVAARLATTEFDALDEIENSVLFLDEFNRAPKSVRGTLLTLIQDHMVPDDREPGKMRYLKNFLFTIAAINPYNANYNTDALDDAEQSRFKEVQVYSDPKVTMNYLVKFFEDEAKDAKADGDAEWELESLRKTELAKKLLGSKYFTFDNYESIDKSKEEGNGKILTARTLTDALQDCNGTKGSLLAVWDDHASSLKKDMVKKILADFEDLNLDDFEEVDNKANRVLKKKPAKKEEPEEEQVFGNTTDKKEFVRNKLGKLAGAIN